MKHFISIFFVLILTNMLVAQENRFAMASPKVVDGNVSKFEVGVFCTNLIKAMTDNNLKVVSRGPAVDAIVKDFDFEVSGVLTDGEKAKLSQLENVNYLCLTSIAEKNGVYYFVATIVDKAIGENVAMVSAMVTDFGNIESVSVQLAKEMLMSLGINSTPTNIASIPFHESQELQNEKDVDVNAIHDADSVTSQKRTPKHNLNIGKTYTERKHGLNMKFVRVDGGTFTMGCTCDEPFDCGNDEFPVHSVTISTFYIGVYEVTQAQWEAVMGTTIYQQKQKSGINNTYGVGDNYPMYYVSWEEAADFARELSRMTGKNYRLPTEAEWEYAARGGSHNEDTKYAGCLDIDHVAWYSDNSGGSTHPVGQKMPNALGLYDMSGNVWEWCADWYSSSYYSSSSQTDPAGPSSGSFRVYRGGSWFGDAQDCRVAYRSFGTPSYRYCTLGFRLVLVP